MAGDVIDRPNLSIQRHLGAIRGWYAWKEQTKIKRLLEMQADLQRDARLIGVTIDRYVAENGWPI